MKLSIAPVVVSVALLNAGTSFAGQVTERELVRGPWQLGLVGKARAMPVGLAFQTGVTAAVLRLLPDRTARVETPCRNEDFIKKIGENLVYKGTWELGKDDVLVYTVSFRGHSQTESGRVEIRGEEMRLYQSNGVVRQLGRFYGNVDEACRYE